MTIRGFGNFVSRVLQGDPLNGPTAVTGTSSTGAASQGMVHGDAFGPSGSVVVRGALTPGARVSLGVPRLTAADAKKLEVGDEVLKAGHGVLTGQLVMRDVQSTSPMFAATTQQQPVLVTAHMGRRHEVFWPLDLPASEARKLLASATGSLGVRVQIEGEFTVSRNNGGTAKGCRVAASDVPALYHDPGDRLRASGRVSLVSQNGSERGIPLGHYLDLDTPIIVHGEEVKSLFLPGADTLSLQQRIEVDLPLLLGRFSEQGAAVHYLELKDLGRYHQQGDPPRVLDRDTLASISDGGGWRVHGHGKLQGQIDLVERNGKQLAVLVTAQRSLARQEFVLDVPAAQVASMRGQWAQVKGLITHEPGTSKIEAPTVKGIPAPPVYREGDALTVEGMVKHSWKFVGGVMSTEPEVTLHLARPIQIGDRRTQELVLEGGGGIEKGTKLQVEGKLALYAYANNMGESVEGVKLTHLANLGLANTMDAFFVEVEDVTQDFPYRMAPRIRVEVPLDQS